MAGQHGTRDTAGVVVETDQRIEFMRGQLHFNRPPYLGLVDREVGAEQPECFQDRTIEIGGHPARHADRIRRPGRDGMADAEGPDVFHVPIGPGHETFVPGEGR